MVAAELRRLLILANPFKEGDVPLGGTADERVREAARRALLATTLGDIRRTVLVDDGVTAALDRSRDRRHDSELDARTIADIRTALTGAGAVAWVRRYAASLPSEAIAAIVKCLDDDELSQVARTIFNPHPGDGLTIGAPAHFGSRIQPNSPGDSDVEILFSILDGLVHGCGDVIIGLNPASDDVDTIVRLEQQLEQVVGRLDLPTRFCVLSDIVKQHAAARYTRIDVAFQSLAGTSRGLTGMVGLDVDGLAELAARFDGLYFETGQGAEATNGAAEGIDMVTLEARTYGVARHLQGEVRRRRGLDGTGPWTIVNDVAGFIGPEVFRTAAQLERTCLEDAVMAKLHGLTMGLDVCATFHMGITPAELREVTTRVVERAAPAYLMAVAGSADPMLGYLTTSFRQHPDLRARTGRRVTSPMAARLRALGVMTPDGEARPGTASIARLYAAQARAGGDSRSTSALEDEARRMVDRLRDRGFDLGLDARAADARLDALYEHARRALFATVDESVIRGVAPEHVAVATRAMSRDEYLARPATGERLRDADARTLAGLRTQRLPQVVIVISDGLNADAINEQLPLLLPPVRHLLGARGCHVAGAPILVRNGRVRAGYEIGGLCGAEVVVHLIGERPGTGLNTASAYLTYGRDEHGEVRWSPSLEHAATTAICGIHPRGKPPAEAAAEIAANVARMLDERRSGVALHTGV